MVGEQKRQRRGGGVGSVFYECLHFFECDSVNICVLNINLMKVQICFSHPHEFLEIQSAFHDIA